jgi:peptide/nickel transport system ATP-binding protein
MHLDFESGTLDGWSAKRLSAPHSAVIQSEVARTGRRACRFELRPGDYVSQGHRAELRDPYNVVWDEEVWYGFSTRLSEDFWLPENIGCVFAQWHDQAKLGDPSGKPPIAIRYRAGRLFVTGAYGRVASPEPDIRYEFASVAAFPRGVWHDFVFRVFWSRHGCSEIEAWLNGGKLIDWRGPLGYENEEEGPYFKLGLYWSPVGARPIVAYHDNYSRGHSYAQVDPSITHTGPAREPSPPCGERVGKGSS